MARTESRAYDAYFDPVWATAGGPKAPAVKFDAAAMSGSGRYKFFQRPMVPHLDAVAPGVLLAPTAEVDPLARLPASNTFAPRARRRPPLFVRACVPEELRSRVDVQHVIRGAIGPYL